MSAVAAGGVTVEGLAWHRFAAGGPPGLVLGYANLSVPAIERGIDLLVAALAQTRTRRVSYAARREEECARPDRHRIGPRLE